MSGATVQRAIVAADPHVRGFVLGHAREECGDTVQRTVDVIREQREARELVQRERLSAFGRLARGARRPRELEGRQLGDRDRVVRVESRKGAPDAQRHKRPCGCVARRERADEHGGGHAAIGERDRDTQLGRRAGAHRLADRVSDRRLLGRILGEVVRASGPSVIDEHERQRVELAERRKRGEADLPRFVVGRRVTHRARSGAEEATDRRGERPLLTDDAVSGVPE
jgi:hypothetical protein